MLAAALLDVALKLHHRQRGKNTARGDLRLFDQIVHLQRAVFQRAQNGDLVIGQPRVVFKFSVGSDSISSAAACLARACSSRA